MNTIKSGLINWKTTIISSLLAVLLLMQDTTDLSNWREWVLPAIIQVLGILMRDADKSSENSGVAPLLLLGLCSVFMFPCCAAIDVSVDKSQLKSETATHAIYPSSAVKPVINPDEVSKISQELIDKANESLANATK